MTRGYEMLQAYNINFVGCDQATAGGTSRHLLFIFRIWTRVSLLPFPIHKIFFPLE